MKVFHIIKISNILAFIRNFLTYSQDIREIGGIVIEMKSKECLYGVNVIILGENLGRSAYFSG